MSVLIKGMKMTHDCFECPLALSPENDDDPYWTCCGNGMKVHEAATEECRPYNCPLEEITEEVRHGRWIEADDFYESGVCSVCKWNSGELHGICIKEWHYCPNCGAKMDGDTE